ncbi:hypothetical protein BDV97DRAFT_157342 [Delphinella strobiligena]|nr:hypothetical protein BDV97DRAFT_157342 [Delphinella strobiligena]
MMSHSNTVLPFPAEIRDAIYALLLNDELFTIRKKHLDEVNQGIEGHEVSIHECLLAEMLRINKQTKFEYERIAYENMRLSVFLTLASDKGPFRLHSLASYTGLPSYVHDRLQSVSIEISYGTFTPTFPQVHGLKQLVASAPALRWLNVDVFLMVDLLETYCPDVHIPTVWELFAKFPEPAGQLRGVTSNLGITSHMFEQNPNYHWSDTSEAKLVGDAWLHSSNKSIFLATRSSGPYHWRGLDLDYKGLGIEWDELLKECVTNPVHSQSPYVT